MQRSEWNERTRRKKNIVEMNEIIIHKNSIVNDEWTYDTLEYNQMKHGI